MAKRTIPAINVPIVTANGSMELAWYLFMQWVSESATQSDLSNYFTKEETETLLGTKVDIVSEPNKIYGTDNDGNQYIYSVSYFAVDNNVVHKTGDENIDGRKTFFENIFFNATVYFKNGLRALFEDTASSKYVDFSDKNGRNSAWLENRINDGGVPGATRLNLWARTYTDNTYTTTVDAAISILAKPDGTAIASAPNTPNDTTTNNVYIATTKWANNSTSGVNNLLHKTGNENSTGIKTFESVSTGYLTVRGSTSSTSREGGEILLGSAPSEPNAGKNVFIDRYNGSVRIFGTNSSGNTKVLLQADIENQIIYAVTPKTDNDSSTEIDTVGARNAAFLSKMTNCITETPQDINLTLSGGTLTLKSGSKIYVPNGGGVFDAYTLPSDKSVTPSGFSTSSNRFVIVTPDKNLAMVDVIADYIYSGATAPTTFDGGGKAYWYDTTNNVIKRTGDSGSTWASGYSFPIAIVDITNGVGVSKIDQVFNGFGYIGSTIFALPNVKGLIPNGRNADGTLKNTIFTTSSVLTQTFSGGNRQRYCVALSSSSITAFSFKYGEPESGFVTYQEKENYNYASTTKFMSATIGWLDTSSGKVSLFKTNSSFHVIDYNDMDLITHQAMPSDKYITLSTSIGTGYSFTAPADGYLSIVKGGSAGDWMYMRNNTSGLNIGVQYVGPLNGRLCVPISKNQTVQINWSGTGTVSELRFIYANGAK